MAQNSRQWPDPLGVQFWPAGAPREVTVPAFETALAQLGYRPCIKRTPEKGLDKVALFALAGVPTHLAKLVPEGKWSSKLGEVEDIEHTLDALQGPQYGSVVQVFCRSV